MPHCSHHHSIPRGEIKRQNTKITQIPHLPCAHQCPHGLCAFDSGRQIPYQQPKSAQLCLCQAINGRSKPQNLFFISREERFFSGSALGGVGEKSVWVCEGVLYTVLLFISLLSFAASSTSSLKKSINIVFILHLILLLYLQDSFDTLF